MTPTTGIEVIAPGPLATLQDLGRPGYAHLGVGRSGAADRDAMTLANRLVGNIASAAVIESTMGGLRIRASGAALVAVTGAIATVTVDSVAVGVGAAITMRAGDELTIATPINGCRNYCAVRGGFEATPVLGSRATDTLSGLGPAPLTSGQQLPIGTAFGQWPALTHVPLDSQRHLELDVTPGPRADRVRRAADLAVGYWEVSSDSDRVGVRLRRPADDDSPLLLHRDDSPTAASEGLAHGSVQVPPSGNPVLFCADHPVTGGYPVTAVLSSSSLNRVAQLVAGDRVRFRIR